jgi:anti-anti-sigma factor
MEINVSENNGVTVVAIEGSLDTQTAQEAQNKLAVLIDNGADKILVNFDKLEYISSAGLRSLLFVAKKIKSKSGDFRICCLNEVVTEVFEISGFSTIINVSDDEVGAISEF